jgi:hypothetical protein
MRLRQFLSPHLFLPMVLALAVAAPAAALQAPQQPAHQPTMTNADLVKLVQAGVPESAIIASIHSSAPAFDLSSDGMVALHKAGVTEGELEAAIAASSAIHPAAAPAAPAAPAPPAAAASAATHIPTVALLVNGSPRVIPLEKVQLAETKNKPTSMNSLASDTVLGQSMQAGVNVAAWDVAGHTGSYVGYTAVDTAGGVMSGMMARRKPTVTYVWGITGAASSNVSPSSLPVFLVSFADVPGVNADDYEPAILKLTPAQNSARLLGATQGKEDARSNAAANWQVYSNFLEDRVAIQTQKTARGQYRIVPTSPLLPGEYGVALRPLSKSKQFSGADIMRGQGDGMIFNAAWSFQVPPDAKAE